MEIEIAYWWLDQEEIEFLNSKELSIPSYLKEELESMLGRPLRGRLWANQVFKDTQVGIDDWDDLPTTTLKEYLVNCGGVVLFKHDAFNLGRFLPGIFTNQKLERLL